MPSLALCDADSAEATFLFRAQKRISYSQYYANCISLHISQSIGAIGAATGTEHVLQMIYTKPNRCGEIISIITPTAGQKQPIMDIGALSSTSVHCGTKASPIPLQLMLSYAS